MKTRATLPTTIIFSILAAAAVMAIGRPVAAAEHSAVVAITAGSEHSCALDAAGAVRCWGSNEFGQLGNDVVDGSALPVPVALPADAHIVAVAAGGFHTCAVARDHRVFCWGSNGYGQLGIGAVVSSATPQPVTLVPTDAHPTDVTAGGFTSCVLLSNGAAQCWGRNQYGEVGDSTRTLRNTPTAVIGIVDAVDIDAGENHVCVLRAVGRMQCWGRNTDGRTGDAAFPNVAELSAGRAHTCARTTTGGLRCWGSNTAGQLPAGDIGAGVAHVAAGGDHTCIATTAGEVTCWGETLYGQLGNTSIVAEGRLAVEVAAGSKHTCARLDDASVWCWGLSMKGQAGDQALTTTGTAVRIIEGLLVVEPEPTPVEPEPSPVDNQPAAPAPVVDTPAATVPETATPVPETATPVPTIPPVEKQVTETPVPVPSIPRLRHIDVRLGQQVGLVRIARAAGVRLPASLIAGSLSRARSVSAHPFTALRVEMSVSHPRNCRNVLTPTLGAAVRAVRVGECRVVLRISRPGRPTLVRTVGLRTAAMIAPVNNPARNTR